MIDLLESAFVNNRAAFYWESSGGGHRVDVFDFWGEVQDFEEWTALRNFATALQPLVFFAFEEAPDEVIIRWGDDHVTDAGRTALERVETIRSAMPIAGSEWASRFSNLGNSLGDLTTSVIYSPETGDFRTIVRINSFTAEGVRRAPAASSRQYLSAVLSRAELRRLIDKLQMADAFYPDDSDEEIIEESSPESQREGGSDE